MILFSYKKSVPPIWLHLPPIWLHLPPIWLHFFYKNFITFLHSWEAGGKAAERNGNYIVVDDGAHIPTAGYGVALKYNVERFASYGIDVRGMTFGDEIPKNIVDAVEMEEINEEDKVSKAGT